MSSSPRATSSSLSLTQWLVLIMAAIGFGFDIYVLLIMQYIGPGALGELLPNVKPGSPEFNLWRGLMFLPWAVPAVVTAYAWRFLFDKFPQRARGKLVTYLDSHFESRRYF